MIRWTVALEQVRTDGHNEWSDNPLDADFGEAGSDYAASVSITPILSRLTALRSGDAELLHQAKAALQKIELLATNHGGWLENDPRGLLNNIHATAGEHLPKLTARLGEGK